MPELPEVETVKRTLTPYLINKRIARVKIYHPGVITIPDPDTFSNLITEKIIKSLGRRGKYIIFHLSEGYCLIGHLRMTGQLTLTSPDAPLLPHTHVVFTLDNDSQLRWVDTRRFGRLYLVKEEELSTTAGLKKLGPEPLDPAFKVKDLANICSGRKKPIKQVLLDQTLIAGIGNIYADEMLFLAGVDPRRAASSLTLEEIKRLYEAMKTSLEQGIKNNGTSIRDYVDGSGKRGSNQDFLKVYGRANKPCLFCGEPLLRIKIGGRSTHFCSHCQK
ncbi:MAG: formamidopyrimidine-DNA glycosylase [Clostridia bacterium]|nr:formamidopyrimidine-DNA glycosylase [Clostridia bacterium]